MTAQTTRMAILLGTRQLVPEAIRVSRAQLHMAPASIISTEGVREENKSKPFRDDAR